MNTFTKHFGLRAILIITSLILLVSSCDKIKELLTVSISTTIEGNIPLHGNVPQNSSFNITKASAVNYDIKQNISIADNPDLKPYLKKIKEIDIKSVQIQFNGLKTGQNIDFISIDVLGVGTLVSLTNVTMSNNSFSPTISNDLLKSISDKLLNNNSITINLKGGANSSINANVDIKMDAKIKAQALD